MVKSHNGIVEYALSNANSPRQALLYLHVNDQLVINCNSHMRSNLSFFRYQYGINCQSHSLAHCIKYNTYIALYNKL